MRRKVRIGAIFACKVLLEAIFGPVQKWRSRAGWGWGWGWGWGLGGWGLGLGARAGAGGSGWGLAICFHFYILKEILMNFDEFL